FHHPCPRPPWSVRRERQAPPPSPRADRERALILSCGPSRGPLRRGLRPPSPRPHPIDPPRDSRRVAPLPRRESGHGSGSHLSPPGVGPRESAPSMGELPSGRPLGEGL